MRYFILISILFFIGINNLFSQKMQDYFSNKKFLKNVKNLQNVNNSYDKVKHFDWNNDDWDSPYFRYFHYNENNNLSKIVDINIENGDTISKISYTYLDENPAHLTSEIKEIYNDEVWSIESGERHIITETSDSTKECISQIYLSEAEIWFNETKKEVTYDENNIEKILMDYNYDGDNWIENQKFVFNYDETNEIDEIFVYVQEEEFEKEEMLMGKMSDISFFQFNPILLGIMDHLENCKFYGNNGYDFIFIGEIITVYGDNESFVISIYQEGSLDEKVTVNYNEHGDLVEMIDESYDEGELLGISEQKKHLLTYDENNKIIEDIEQVLSWQTNGVLVNNYKDEYLEHNNISSEQITEYENFYIFPNPSVDFISVNSNKNHKNLSVEILNIYGQVVFESKELENINISNFKNGIYFIRLKNQKEILKIKKFIKK